MTKTISIDKIELIQIRLNTNPDVVTEYAEAMERGDKFPLISIFTDGKLYWCADGIHRILAYQRRNKKMIDCDIKKGTRSDALKFALGANDDHGLHRSNADKRHAIEMALTEFPKLGDRAIADLCKVSHPTVSEVRKSLPPPAEPEKPAETPESKSTGNSSSSTKPPKPAKPPTRVGRDGKARRVSAPPKPPKKKLEKDETGLPIPAPLLPLWEKRDASAALVTGIAYIRKEIQKAQEKSDPLFVHVDFTNNLALLNQVYEDMKQAIPYAVCRKCNGTDAEITKECKTCKGSGFISEFIWKNVLSDKDREIATPEPAEE